MIWNLWSAFFVVCYLVGLESRALEKKCAERFGSFPGSGILENFTRLNYDLQGELGGQFNKMRQEIADFTKINENLIVLYSPLNLPTNRCIDVLKTMYPSHVFNCYNWEDFMLVNHLVPGDWTVLTNKEKDCWMKCLVGSYRSSIVAENFNVKPEESFFDIYTWINRQMAFPSEKAKANSVMMVLDTNKKIVKKVFKREELNISNLSRLSFSIPVELDVASFTWLIMSLFPDAMFRFFHHDESLFITRLTISKKFASTSGAEALSEVFTECLMGIMRTKAITNYAVNCRVDMDMYLGQKEYTDKRELISDGSLFSAISNVYTKHGIRIDLDMSDSTPLDRSKISPEIYEALITAWNVSKEVGNESEAFEGRLLKMQSSQAMELIRRLFPEGLFHMFYGAEYILMNLLQPVGRLNSEDRLFWKECLVGCQRSRYISESVNRLRHHKAD
jgi:hypothetical protein